MQNRSQTQAEIQAPAVCDGYTDGDDTDNRHVTDRHDLAGSGDFDADFRHVFDADHTRRRLFVRLLRQSIFQPVEPNASRRPVVRRRQTSEDVATASRLVVRQRRFSDEGIARTDQVPFSRVRRRPLEDRADETAPLRGTQHPGVSVTKPYFSVVKDPLKHIRFQRPI